MKLSVHPYIQGKPIKEIDGAGKSRLVCNGRTINLGYDWQNIDEDWNTVFDLITIDGAATSAYLKNNHRCNENYLSRELVMVDIDDGMKISDLQNNEFYRAYGAGYYSTPSFTEEHHKFRILFRLETPIADSEKMKLVNSALMYVYEYADISCKDAARIFFGTQNAPHREKTDKVLPDDVVSLLMNMVPAVKSTPKIIAPPVSKISATDLGKLLDTLKIHYPLLEYALRLKVAFSVADEIGVQAAIYEMRSRWNDSSLNGKYENMLKDFNKGKSPSLGSIYTMIRAVDPDYKITHKYDDTTSIIEEMKKRGLYGK